LKKKLVIYILALTGLVAGYITVSNLPKSTKVQETNSYFLLKDFEINSVEVENSYGKYNLTYQQPYWIMDGTRIDGGYINRLSNICSRLKLSSSDLKSFGIDNPVSKVILTDKNGAVKTLLIGDFVSDNSGRYVMCDEVYVVSNEYISWLTENKDILRNKMIFSESSPQKVEYNSICFEIVDGSWQMTSPYQHGVRGQELNQEILEKLNFAAVDFSDKSPSECGLDNPSAYLSVWNSEGKKTTLFFGDRVDGLIYAKCEGSDEICRIEIPDFLDKNAVYFLNKLCYVKNIDEIEQIQVGDMLFDISNGKYIKDGKTLNKESFIEFYKKLMGMTLIDEAVNPNKDKLLVKIIVDFKDGKEDIVEVYQYKDRYGAVFINGKCTFYTLAESAEDIFVQAEKL